MILFINQFYTSVFTKHLYSYLQVQHQICLY